MSNIKYTKEFLEPIVAKSKSFADVCRYSNIVPRTGSQTHIAKRIKFYQIDTSHFLGKAWMRGTNHIKTFRPVSEYLVNGSKIKSSVLLSKLLKCGIKKNMCEICQRTEWCDQPIPLELHHLDCNHTNNELSNLQVLCSNCHSLTHKPKIKPKNKRSKKITFCPDCGTKISNNACYCSICYNKYRSDISRKCARFKINWPSKDELLKELETTSYLALSKKLGVSDNAIRKRLKNH